MSDGTNEFDRHADNYEKTLDQSLRISGYSSAYFTERKIREMRSFIRRHEISDLKLRILDFGCGIGNSEPYIASYFPGSEIFGIDVSSGSIAQARERNSGLPGLHFSEFDGVNIPFEGGFDVILMAGVLHHVRPEMRIQVLKSLHDALDAAGTLFIFEHNPWNPVTRKIVRDCPFDENAELVSPSEAKNLLRKSGFARTSLSFIHFFPAFLSFLAPLESLLRRLPAGAQYFFAAGKQEAAA